MRYKRLILCTTILLFAALISLQAQKLNIWEYGGTQSAYTLSEIQRMSFSQGNVTLYFKGDGSDTYAITDIRNLNFNQVTSVVTEPIQMQKKEPIHVFPNPAIDVLNIQLFSRPTSTSVIKILSMDGKVVYTRAISGNSDVYQINISELADGLYVCIIHNELVNETTKFIKK